MPNVDPIVHAWQHCNPSARLPSALLPRAGTFGLVLGQPVPGLSGSAQEARNGLFAIATLPRIAPADEAVADSAGQMTGGTAAGADDPPIGPDALAIGQEVATSQHNGCNHANGAGVESEMAGA